MNENIRTEGQLITAALLLGIGAILLPLSIGMLLSYPDAVWQLGVLMFGANLFLLFGGVRAIIQYKKMNAAKSIEMKKMLQASHGVSTNQPNKIEAPNDVEVLAKWNFESSYWQKFQKVESKIQLRNSIILLALITGGGAWILHDDEGEGWLFSILFAFGFGFFVLVIKFFVSRQNFAVGGSKNVHVLIDLNKVLINDKLYYFNHAERWITDVKLSASAGVDMVEFTYSWKTRSGVTNDTLLIPVPAGKLDEAKALVSKVRDFHQIKHASDWNPRYHWQKKI